MTHQRNKNPNCEIGKLPTRLSPFESSSWIVWNFFQSCQIWQKLLTRSFLVASGCAVVEVLMWFEILTSFFFKLKVYKMFSIILHVSVYASNSPVKSRVKVNLRVKDVRRVCSQDNKNSVLDFSSKSKFISPPASYQHQNCVRKHKYNYIFFWTYSNQNNYFELFLAQMVW